MDERLCKLRLIHESGFVDAHEVLDLDAADGALPQVLAALYAGRVVLAGHVHAVLVILVADYAGVGVRLVAHVGCFYLAAVGRVRSKFEH